MDDLERELRGMLNDRVSGMPDAYEAAPELIARSHRRRAAKLTTIGVTAVVVAAGVTGAVVRSVGRTDTRQVSISTPSTTAPPSTTTAARRPGVAVLGCPVVYGVNGQKLPPPASHVRGRIPAAGDPAELANLASFGATSDPRYVVLGPMTWSCLTTVATDGQNGAVVYDPASTPGMVPDVFKAPIAIVNDYLWHGGVGSGIACSVFSDPALVQYVNRNYPQLGPCPRAGRTVTKVDAHMSRFVDADGARGVAWIALPSSDLAEDGTLTVLTCRPTAGLTAAACDTIIAEFEARNDSGSASAAANAIADAPFAASDLGSTTNGIVITDARSERVAAYDAPTDTWRTLSVPPFHGRTQFVATRGDNVFAIGEPPSGSTTTPFAVLDVGTGRWRSLEALPDQVFGRLETAGDASRVFAFAATDGEVQRQIAVEYDIAANRWTNLPAPPLRPRILEALQWTGRELLIWGGGDAHQGGIAADPDGAAYEPVGRTWRKLPAAPVPPRLGAANVWTGTELLVWGGSDCGGCGTEPIGAGAAYDPATNEWRKLATSPLRATRFPPAVWTGSEMVVSGNFSAGIPAAAYDPATDSWRSLPAVPASAPLARRGLDTTFASWTGHQVVFGVVAQSETGWDFAASSYKIGG